MRLDMNYANRPVLPLQGVFVLYGRLLCLDSGANYFSENNIVVAKHISVGESEVKLGRCLDDGTSSCSCDRKVDRAFQLWLKT
jgi:hypothetical protein